MLTLSSIALVGAACGRVSHDGDESGGGSGGASTGTPGGATGGAGKATGGTTSGSGGRATGSGGSSGQGMVGKVGPGPSLGGAPSDGTLGGDSGVGGEASGGAPPCRPTSGFGDGTGCHAKAECDGVEVDLYCLETDSNIPCTCSIGSKVMWEIVTNFAYAKAGCFDEELFRLCTKELR